MKPSNFSHRPSTTTAARFGAGRLHLIPPVPRSEAVMRYDVAMWPTLLDEIVQLAQPHLTADSYK